MTNPIKTTADYNAWQMKQHAMKLARQHNADKVGAVEFFPHKHADGLPVIVEPESKLHRQILDYCDAQWPRWKVIRARMDRRSTIPAGCQDLTIFASERRVFLFECKKRGEKLTIKQRDWAAELKLLGWTVHKVETFEGFIEKVKNEKGQP